MKTVPPIRFFVALVPLLAAALYAQPSQLPRSFEEADERAGTLLAQMSTDEKLQLISGYNSFFIHGFPRLGIPDLGMSDATQGVHIRKDMKARLAKSTAFPCPIALAATWNPELAYDYAHAVGEECRAGDIAILLGPGMNIYRQSQGGRNFEYFGEDPLLAARMIGRYVRGVLDTGTMPTLKHFVANNTDFRRRTSNSVVDERTLHEIYLPAFKAGVDAGATAVMTSYNQLNGEWCGQSRTVITDILRGQLGFKWLVMTDWNSVWDAEKVIKSGQDLEMPGKKNIETDAKRLLDEGKVSMSDIDRMARSILRACAAMGFYDRPVTDEKRVEGFPEHVDVALRTAREGIVLLKNNGVLPVAKQSEGRILVTGLYVERLARGGGSAEVAGYDVVTLKQALAEVYGDRVDFVDEPTDEQVKTASVVFLSTGTFDSEGWDRPFALREDDEQRIQKVVSLNPRTVVIVNTGSGIQMSGWNDRAAAIVYSWYPGQVGNRALAEILCGDTNPSGKLPITIERRFEDSPGFGYIPAGEKLYTGWKLDGDMTLPLYNIDYKEGVFVGYRWYEAKEIVPLYAFGAGLSYTTFGYADAKVSTPDIAPTQRVTLTCTVRNTGKVAGSEVVQLYVRPLNPPVARPERELKGFARVMLAPGESREVSIMLNPDAFAYWDVSRHGWNVASGEYELLLGGASDRIAAKCRVTIR